VERFILSALVLAAVNRNQRNLRVGGSEKQNPSRDLRKTPVDRSGVSAERRKLEKIDDCGFLPKAAKPPSSRMERRFEFGQESKGMLAISPAFPVKARRAGIVVENRN
jgi:hypothetical protein